MKESKDPYLKFKEPVRTTVDPSGAIWNLLMLQFNKELQGNGCQINLGLAVQSLGLNIALHREFLGKLMTLWDSKYGAKATVPQNIEGFIFEAYQAIQQFNARELSNAQLN